MSHYGHFITESLSRFWLIDHFYFDRIVFSYFIFGDKINKFHKEIFKIFKIYTIEIVSTTSLFEELWIPEQLWLINSKPNIGIIRVYSFIKEYYIDQFKKTNILSTIQKDKRGGGRYLLSDKNINGRIKNKNDVDKIFSSKGIKVIYPEELSFSEQIKYYLDAELIICYSGTLSNNVLFCDWETVSIIEIGDIRSRNKVTPMQQFIYTLGEINYKFIPYVGDKNGNISLKDIKLLKI